MTGDDGADDRTASRRTDAVSDDVFLLLSHRYRRYALYYLLEHETVSLEELADVVTGWTHVDTAPSSLVGRTKRDRIATALVHRHVPMMEGADLVSVDRDSGTVSREEWPSAVTEFVELAREAEAEADVETTERTA